jgi:pimeloyl-ACP methyl ester carboxylesterase
MAAGSTRRLGAVTAVRHVAGFVELTGRFGGEIAALVQEVHAAASPMARLPARRPAPVVYGGIRLGFTGARRVAALSRRLLPREPEPDAWLDVQSALNGAFGHLFAESGSPYALPMSLREAAPAPRGQRRVVFLHGLCMNERCWNDPAHHRFVAWARRRLATGVSYLRYNTGLRISINGGQLAELLEREAGEGELILIGHSMGGLVALSALHQAQERGHGWPRRVRGIACLGSPHEGTSLERLGNHANRLLLVFPWSRPFMRLGNLRSDGIRDLRFGHLLEQEWRHRHPDDPRPAYSAVSLAPHVDHLFVAAARNARGETDPVGDWLVPVESALARNLHPEGAARRALVRDLDHMSLPRDRRVYSLLRRWLDEPL